MWNFRNWKTKTFNSKFARAYQIVKLNIRLKEEKFSDRQHAAWTNSRQLDRLRLLAAHWCFDIHYQGDVFLRGNGFLNDFAEKIPKHESKLYTLEKYFFLDW